MKAVEFLEMLAKNLGFKRFEFEIVGKPAFFGYEKVFVKFFKSDSSQGHFLCMRRRRNWIDLLSFNAFNGQHDHISLCNAYVQYLEMLFKRSEEGFDLLVETNYLPAKYLVICQNPKSLEEVLVQSDLLGLKEGEANG